MNWPRLFRDVETHEALCMVWMRQAKLVEGKKVVCISSDLKILGKLTWEGNDG